MQPCWNQESRTAQSAKTMTFEEVSSSTCYLHWNRCFSQLVNKAKKKTLQRSTVTEHALASDRSGWFWWQSNTSWLATTFPVPGAGCEHNKACFVIKVQLGMAFPGTTDRKSISAARRRAARADNIIIALGDIWPALGRRARTGNDDIKCLLNWMDSDEDPNKRPVKCQSLAGLR